MINKVGWEKKKIEEICAVINGFAFDSASFSDIESGMPLIRIRDVVRGYTKTYFNGSYSENYIVKKGELLIGMDGEFNIGKWNSENALLNQRVCKLKIDSQFTTDKFIYYFMPKALKAIEDKTPFVTVKHISSKQICNIKINLPPLPIQQQIVSELDTLSDIISKKKQQLADLDILAQATFYELFGDPVSNEKGWKMKLIGEISSLKSGQFVKASDIQSQYFKGLYPCFGGNGLRGYTKSFTHNGEFVLIGRQGALCGNVKIAKDVFHATEHAVVCTPLKTYETIWFYYILKILNLNKYATGAAQPGLAVGKLEKIEIPFSPILLQRKFARQIESIEEQKELINKSIVEVQHLFDYTMDRYFN